MYKTPVVFWRSQWVTLKNQYTYRVDPKTKQEIAEPKQLFVGVINKEYFRREING